jgi:uncharacterized protein YeaO (DUF488 family)
MPAASSVKRVYEAPAETDGARFLVDRLWPRGLSKNAARRGPLTLLTATRDLDHAHPRVLRDHLRACLSRHPQP